MCVCTGVCVCTRLKRDYTSLTKLQTHTRDVHPAGEEAVLFSPFEKKPLVFLEVGTGD